MKRRVLLGWSGGKDAAMALHELKRTDGIEVAALLTTVTEGYDRISMHGVRRELLEKQAGALGYPLDEVLIPQTCTNEVYEERMRKALARHQREGVTAAAFGDLFSRTSAPTAKSECDWPA
jgi:diphthamide synthase (EF-2-diphthine--ammonia ligase)